MARGWKCEGADPEELISEKFRAYLREPRRGFRSCDWRDLIFFRLGLLILKVPLPTYSA